MSLHSLIAAMPKVELHVHLEGAVQPETLLELARKNGVTLPADSVEAIARWYTFVDFPHFIEIYLKISECIQTAEDIELITREFLAGQAAQNIVYTEATYTAYTHFLQAGISFADQLAAINRARAWARETLGVQMNLIIDIDRGAPAETGLIAAQWVVDAYGDGVVAFGMGGYEIGNPPEKHRLALEYVQTAGVPCVLHAGETDGAASIWGALRTGKSVRIGHGVRCLEDPALVDELRQRQIPLEVCPTSNVCLGVAPSLIAHPLPELMAHGLYVTLNSDDPPMFNTTLTQEFQQSAQAFGWSASTVETLTLNAARASLLPENEKRALETRLRDSFRMLRREHLQE
ncbi:MAG: adenosine deaminase [Anaerolineae bacterium]|nr:adenosine deaminase [Anaerolineae bacterium]